VEEVSDKEIKVRAHKADLTSSKEVEMSMSEASKYMGGIDILVTCAGGYKAYRTFDDITDQIGILLYN